MTKMRGDLQSHVRLANDNLADKQQDIHEDNKQVLLENNQSEQVNKEDGCEFDLKKVHLGMYKDGLTKNFIKIVFILRHLLKTLKAKSSTQTGHFRRFSFPMFCHMPSR